MEFLSVHTSQQFCHIPPFFALISDTAGEKFIRSSLKSQRQLLQEFKKDTYVEYLGYGIYCVERKDKENLIDKNGLIAQDVEGDQRSLLVYDDNKMLVLNKGEYSLELEADQVTLLQPALVAAYSDDNACYGVFDMFTGEQLLPYEYHAIEVSGNYLYAYKGGEYSVYEVIAPEY